jgi:hypothetical protein
MLLQPRFVVPRVELTRLLGDRDCGLDGFRNVMTRCFALSYVTIYIVTYDVAKPRNITLREKLHPRSRTFKARNITKYRGAIKCADELAYADIEIRNTNLWKDSANNTIKQSIQHEKPMQNRNQW